MSAGLTSLTCILRLLTPSYDINVVKQLAQDKFDSWQPLLKFCALSSKCLFDLDVVIRAVINNTSTEVGARTTIILYDLQSLSLMSSSYHICSPHCFEVEHNTVKTMGTKTEMYIG